MNRHIESIKQSKYTKLYILLFFEKEGLLIRKHADMLVCHCAAQGYIANRYIELRSWCTYVYKSCVKF